MKNKRKKEKKYNIKTINLEFKKRGFKLLTKEYENINQKLKYVCDNGHLCEISYTEFRRGSGCKACSVLSVANKNRHSFDYIFNFFKKEGYELISKTYKTISEKLECKCPRGHFIKISFDSFSRNHRCQICNESKGERKISKWLIEKNIFFEKEKTFDGCKNKNRLRFDFYIPQTNTLIEYDGIHHFAKTKQCFGSNNFDFKGVILNDMIKNKFAKKNKINLLRIKYCDFENIEEILNTEVLIKWQSITLS